MPRAYFMASNETPPQGTLMLNSNSFYLLDYLNILSQDLEHTQDNRAEKKAVIEKMKTEIFAKALPKV